MYPQRLRATAIASPHPDSRKQTSTFNDKDAKIGEKAVSDANRVRTQSPSARSQRRIGGLVQLAPQLAQLASKFESKSQSIRLRFSPGSIAEDHFRQKRISFNQCPAVKAGTPTASGVRPIVQGLSPKRGPTMPKNAAASCPHVPRAPHIRPRAFPATGQHFRPLPRPRPPW